jgi:hypothetical protein
MFLSPAELILLKKEPIKPNSVKEKLIKVVLLIRIEVLLDELSYALC